VNGRFEDEDELPVITKDPENDGWMVKVQVAGRGEFDKLLTKAQYDDFVAKEGGGH
jgi:glycine cleavage system H lipoate-binding protein